MRTWALCTPLMLVRHSSRRRGGELLGGKLFPLSDHPCYRPLPFPLCSAVLRRRHPFPSHAPCFSRRTSQRSPIRAGGRALRVFETGRGCRLQSRVVSCNAAAICHVRTPLAITTLLPRSDFAQLVRLLRVFVVDFSAADCHRDAFSCTRRRRIRHGSEREDARRERSPQRAVKQAGVRPGGQRDRCA